MSIKHWDSYWESIKEKDFTLIADISRKKEAEVLLDEINELGEDIKILEPGCGSATGSMIVADKGNIVGLDFSIEALKRAVRNFANVGRKIECVQGDMNNMGFDNNSFDLVWNQGVLEHFDDIKKPFSEMVRVCKKNGKIIVFIPGRRSWEYLIYRLHYATKIVPWAFGKQDWYTSSELKELLYKGNEDKLELKKITGVVPLFPPVPFRGKFVKKILKPISWGWEKIENVLPDSIKAMFGRNICLVFVKK